jgi:hypothetical protein
MFVETDVKPKFFIDFNKILFYKYNLKYIELRIKTFENIFLYFDYFKRNNDLPLFNFLNFINSFFDLSLNFL